jgi:hypothetical protein
MYAYVYVYLYVSIHTYTHAHTHRRTHTHTHIPSSLAIPRDTFAAASLNGGIYVGQMTYVEQMTYVGHGNISLNLAPKGRVGQGFGFNDICGT